MSIVLHDFSIVKNKLIVEKNIDKKIEEILKDGSTCIAKYYQDHLITK